MSDRMKIISSLLLIILLFINCEEEEVKPPIHPMALKPDVVTEKTNHDTDDPAIWINSKDPAKSLIIGTDKDQDGALYVYDLQGNIQADKVARNLKRPNNVDIEYGLMLNGKPIDIAVTTERLENRLRVFSLPDMKCVDNNGIEVFTGEEERAPMGISLYKRPSDGNIYAIVGRKFGPSGTYLWQYLLKDDGNGNVTGELVRKFGKFSGQNEIEAIAVDDELGFVYCSDEGVGVRKYYADPDKGNKELALFATQGFIDDNEGISIYTINDGTGYILVSDQQRNAFHVFPREGSPDNPHKHELIKIVYTSTMESDGNEVTNAALNATFSQGLFVAMSEGKTFHYYSWEKLADCPQLEIAVNGEKQ